MSVDAMEFTKSAMEEVKARLAQKGDKTVKQVLMKFFDDQGHVFTNMDIGEIEKYVESQLEPKIDPKKKI